MLAGSRGLSGPVAHGGRAGLGWAGLGAELPPPLCSELWCREPRSGALRAAPVCNPAEQRHGRLSRELVVFRAKHGSFAASLMLWAKLVSQENCHAADLPGLLVVETQAQGAQGFCF